MTEKIYDADPHMLSFQATVLSCEAASSLPDGFTAPPDTPCVYAVILNRTAFFPEEGGQGSDTGTLGGLPVLHVSIDKEDTLTHYLPAPLAVTEEVNGEVDWERRFDSMQQHTGEHILSGLVNSRFGFHNVGFHLGEEVTTLDFDGVLTPEELRQIVIQANEAVWADLPVRASFPTPKELAALSYRSKLALTGAVRIVEIPGIDRCACCAPHVDRTGQIGLIQVTSMESHRGGVRLTLLCGRRALSHSLAQQESLSALSVLLSAKPELITDAVARLKEESSGRRERIHSLQAKLLSARLSALPAPGQLSHVLLFEEELDTKAVRDAVNLLTASYPGYCAVFTGNDAEGYRFILGSSKLDCRTAASSLRTVLEAKCGGSAQMIQGSVSADEAALRSLFQSLPAPDDHC